MNKFIHFFYIVCFLVTTFPCQGKEKESVIAGYFAEWGVYARNYHVNDIPADKITHVIYAFAQIANGEIALFDAYAATDKFYPGDRWDEPLRGNFKQLQLLKAKYPHIKTLIAIGGWTLSNPFSDVAITAESRRKFAISAANFVEKYGFDGIDIDWEYPCGGGLSRGRNEDKHNFTLLMAELRNQLSHLKEKTGQEYLLTVASRAAHINTHYELAEVAKHIDWFNVMTYDFHGAWENITNHQAPLYSNSRSENSENDRQYNVASAVHAYIAEGVPPQQIVLGIPFYSRGWAGIGSSAKNGGLFQNASKAADGTWESGVLDYADIYSKIEHHPEQFQVAWDDEAKVSWVYNPFLGGGSFFTFDGVAAVKEKIIFSKSLGLRGFMFWEFSGDLRNANDPASLIHTLRNS